MNESCDAKQSAKFKPRSGKFRLWLLLFGAIALTFTLGMGGNMTKPQSSSSPSGVLYFSDGADIIRYSFKDRKKKVLLSDRHSFFLFPNYSHLRKKVFFLEDALTEGSYISVVGLDFSSTYERIKKLSQRCVTLSLSPDERQIVCSNKGAIILISLTDLSRLTEDIIAENFDERASHVPLIWLSEESILYNSRNSGVLELNLKSRKMTKWDVHDFYLLAISTDKRFILGWDEAKGDILSILDVQTRERIPVKGFPDRPYVHDNFVWSPDANHFVFTEVRAWIDLILNFPMDFTADTPSAYAFSLNTGKARKIVKLTDIHGGFWLSEDPAATQSEGGDKK